MRRFAGTLFGAVITVLGWMLLGVTELGARLIVALVGFVIGHAIARAVLGKPPKAEARSSTLPWIIVGLAALVIVTMMVLKLGAQREAAREARMKVLTDPIASAVEAKPDAAVEAPAARTATIEFDGLRWKITGPISEGILRDVRAKGYKNEDTLYWETPLATELATAATFDDDIRKLFITCAERGSLDALATRRNLEELWLVLCNDVDPAPLAKLGKLRALHFKSNFASIAFVSELAELETLELDGPIDIRLAMEIDILKGKLPADHTFHIVAKSSPLIPLDLLPLARLTKLKKLGFDNRRVADVTALAALTTLEELDLSHTAVTDLTPLKTLKKLKRLEVYGTALKAPALAAIARPGLQVLH